MACSAKTAVSGVFGRGLSLEMAGMAGINLF
jgi:hypothetical protein